MIDTLNNWIGQIQAWRDPMNDYYPSVLWIDTQSGTYGDATNGQLVLVETTEWSQEDCDVWETMTDSERETYGIEYRDYCGHHPANLFPKPEQWETAQ